MLVQNLIVDLFLLVSVLKMLAVMEAGAQSAGPSSVSGSSAPNEPPIKEFLSSGRTGRRNALPDILGKSPKVLD